MSVLPVTHFTWQVLRTLARSRKPLTGRELRVSPSRKTKDGAFLSELVEQGLVDRVTGTAAEPFTATYKLTDLGKHAAEYGECDVAVQPMAALKPAPKRRGGPARGPRA